MLLHTIMGSFPSVRVSRDYLEITAIPGLSQDAHIHTFSCLLCQIVQGFPSNSDSHALTEGVGDGVHPGIIPG